MSNHGVCLAASESFGQVYDCGACGNIHVQVGPVSITLEPRAYMDLVAMISTSAANFETWLQQRNGVDFTGIDLDNSPGGGQNLSIRHKKGIQ